MAAWRDFGNTCRALVTLGADPGQLLDHSLGSALACAPRNDRNRIISRLVRRGANPNLALPGIFPTALAIAVSAGFFRSVKALIAAGARPQIPESQGAQGILLVDAIRSGEGIRIIKTLVKAGVDVNIDEKEGVGGSSLAVAVSTGNLDLVSCVLEAGADVNHTFDGG